MKYCYLLVIYVVGSRVLISHTQAQELTAGLPALRDDGYQTACGPIACFVAARSLGVELSLSTAIDKCSWRPDRVTTLSDVQDALANVKGLNSVPTKISPNELRNYLSTSDYVAILPIRKNSESVNHAVCAIGCKDDSIILIDYPELKRTYTLNELADVWDGPALLVSRSFDSRLEQNIGWFVIPLVTCGLIGWDTIRRRS